MQLIPSLSKALTVGAALFLSLPAEQTSAVAWPFQQEPAGVRPRNIFNSWLPGARSTAASSHPPPLAVEARQLSIVFGSSSLADTWKPPLSTRGRYVVDADGKRFRFQGGNWHGASGTYDGTGNISDPVTHHAGELAFQTVLGLDRARMETIIQDFLDLGINTIRLPFSNEMIHTTAPVPDFALAANPQLRGMTPLEIYDAVIEALTAKGIAVILNNHTVKSIWCCGLDQNSRWNVAQSDQQWQSDWLLLVNRYKKNKRVVGAELYNEVRRDLRSDPNWGYGGGPDWYQASMDCAARIQREANPDILILIEGINWQGIPLAQFAHGRPELSPAAWLSHALPIQDKLVYVAHFYAYTGRNNTGASSGPFVLDDPLYRDLSISNLNSTMDLMSGFVATKSNMHYTAPVWISEFGSAGRYDTLTADRNWWHNFITWMIGRDIEYAVWPLVGWQENGQGDLWAFNAYDSRGNKLSISDNNGQSDWRYNDWQRLTQAKSVKTGTVEAADTFRMLMADNENAIMSNTVAKDMAWYPGDRKAVCPDGLRLLGMTSGNNPRGLCTDVTYGRKLLDDSGKWEFVNDERHVTRDWAPGWTKYTCAPNQHLIGYAFTGRASYGAYCASLDNSFTKQTPITGSRAIYFDKSNVYPIDHGSFTAGGNTGVCNDDEVAMGYAFSTNTNGATPSVLLCGQTKLTKSVPISTINAAGQPLTIAATQMAGANDTRLLAVADPEAQIAAVRNPARHFAMRSARNGYLSGSSL